MQHPTHSAEHRPEDASQSQQTHGHTATESPTAHQTPRVQQDIPRPSDETRIPPDGRKPKGWCQPQSRSNTQHPIRLVTVEDFSEPATGQVRRRPLPPHHHRLQLDSPPTTTVQGETQTFLRQVAQGTPLLLRHRLSFRQQAVSNIDGCLYMGNHTIVHGGRQPAPTAVKPRYNCSKKSFPLSSTTMNAGKSTTSILRTASMPMSSKSTSSTLRMFDCASSAAGPPMLPR